MKENARKNTECYWKIFKVYPDDNYKKFSDIEKVFNNSKKNKTNSNNVKNIHTGTDVDQELRENYERFSKDIRGNIVEFPLEFLKEENLNLSYFCREQLVPIKTFI
jgi:hypothetical protein